jgi:hypothetical protein
LSSADLTAVTTLIQWLQVASFEGNLGGRASRRQPSLHGRRRESDLLRTPGGG